MPRARSALSVLASAVLAAASLAVPLAAPVPAVAGVSYSVAYVNATGTVGTDTSCADPGYTTIGAAIADLGGALATGATINVCAGTYDEHGLTASTDVTLVGAGADTTVVDGQQLGQILAVTGNVTVTGMTFQNGKGAASANGGAISASGDVRVTDAMFIGNATGASSSGGAIWAGGSVIAERVAFSGNTTSVSGGAVAATGAISLVNATVSGNTASVGGAAYSNTRVEAFFSTIAGNTEASGAPLVSQSSTVTFGGDILADNSSPNCAGNFTDGGGNISTDASCTFGGVGLNSVSDPTLSLGALAANAPGAVETMALASGSPAIDLVACATRPFSPVVHSGANLGVDARGVTRPQGTACDAGAYEYVYPVKTAQTITFPQPSDISYTDTGVAVSATASSGLSVSYASLTASVCSVGAITGAITIVAAGTCTIEATQAGDATYAAATPVDRSFAILPANQTVSFTSTAPTNAIVGDTYVPTASATSGLTPVITVDASSNAVCSISGSTVTMDGVGTCTLNADQKGNTDWNAATTATQSFAVSAVPKIATTTSAAVYDGATHTPWAGTETAGATAYGTSAVMTVGVNSLVVQVPTGTVTYTWYANGTCSGAALGSSDTVTLSGGTVPDSASLTPLAAGTYSLKAAYSGDTNYAASMSVCRAFTVLPTPAPIVIAPAPTPQVALKVSASPSTLAGPGSATFTYTVTNPGTVALASVAVTDSACTPAYASGDANANHLLDPGETWTYACTAALSATTTDAATATGSYGGATATATASATVTVSSAAAPTLTSLIGAGVLRGPTGFGTASVIVRRGTYATLLIRTSPALAGKALGIWVMTRTQGWHRLTSRLVAADGTARYFFRVTQWTAVRASFADGQTTAWSHGRIATAR